MRTLLLGLVLAGAVAVSADLGRAGDPVVVNPAGERITAGGFTLRAVTLPPRTIGTSVVRAKPALAVVVSVSLENYVPRAREPMLVIDGALVRAQSGVTSSEGSRIVQSFLVEDPRLLKEGARVAVQLGLTLASRLEVPGSIRHDAIEPPDAAELTEFGLPPLAEWLRSGP